MSEAHQQSPSAMMYIARGRCYFSQADRARGQAPKAVSPPQTAKIRLRNPQKMEKKQHYDYNEDRFQTARLLQDKGKDTEYRSFKSL
eukprot:scaffold1091_cov164-Ochromonas_danica.AAC.84